MKLFILAIIVFWVVKLLLLLLFANKKLLPFLKDFVLASLLGLTASFLIGFSVALLFHIIVPLLSFSKSIAFLCALLALVTTESIYYCIFNRKRPRYEMIIAVVLTNFLALALSGPFLIDAAHKPDKWMLRISCISNIKQIGLALKQYAMDNNNWLPDRSGAAGFEQLRGTDYLTDCGVCVCPSKHYPRENVNHKLTEETVSYIYRAGFKDPPANNEAASKIPVVWDKPDNHKNYGNVLFLDGHVKGFMGGNWMEQAGIKKITTGKGNYYEKQSK